MRWVRRGGDDARAQSAACGWEDGLRGRSACPPCCSCGVRLGFLLALDPIPPVAAKPLGGFLFRGHDGIQTIVVVVSAAPAGSLRLWAEGKRHVLLEPRQRRIGLVDRRGGKGPR